MFSTDTSSETSGEDSCLSLPMVLDTFNGILDFKFVALSFRVFRTCLLGEDSCRGHFGWCAFILFGDSVRVSGV